MMHAVLVEMEHTRTKQDRVHVTTVRKDTTQVPVLRNAINVPQVHIQEPVHRVAGHAQKVNT